MNGNGIVGKAVLALLGVLGTIAVGLGMTTLEDHTARIERLEDRAAVCTEASAEARAELRAIQKQLDRIEKKLEEQ